MTFQAFPKIARWKRDVVVTEKLDGTNAQVAIFKFEETPAGTHPIVGERDGQFYSVCAGSRNRWIAPGKTTDNYGFAEWVLQNGHELLALGEGLHFGEWWGRGIQRGYGVAEKRFSLFNVSRWANESPPLGCDLVPVLYQGPLDEARINAEMTKLSTFGSVAAPGFMNPEGIIIYHTASRTLFKRTFEHDENGKEAA